MPEVLLTASSVKAMKRNDAWTIENTSKAERDLFKALSVPVGAELKQVLNYTKVVMDHHTQGVILLITDFKELVNACKQEVEERQYNSVYLSRLQAGWNRIQTWMEIQGLKEYSRDIGIRFCIEELGGDLSRKDMNSVDHYALRAARMLFSYEEDGDFELRAPRMDHIISGPVGDAARHYLESCENVLSNAS